MTIDYNLCFGCTACEAACPTNAIKMKKNEKGFLFPEISKTMCIQCGKCEKVCPYKTSIEKNEIISSYAFIHNDKSILKKSSSGGLFSALSDIIFAQGGVVYGAVLDKNMHVHHTRATTQTERNAMRGSKYVQSALNDTFSCIKMDLQIGKTVFFTGTPCQVDGLKHFLYPVKVGKLITCDLVCNGVPSPLIWEEHVKFLEKKYHKKMTGYDFRPKKWGWSVHKECAYFEGKKIVHSTAYTDLFRNIYYGRLVMRNSCNGCPYTCLDRVGDVTIADCRNFERIYPQVDTFDGVSLALLNTETGKKLFMEASKNAVIYPVDIKKIMQPPLSGPGKASSHSEEFWDNYRKYGYEYAVKQQYGKFFVEKYFIKKILHKN